jgi:hypothetical protein
MLAIKKATILDYPSNPPASVDLALKADASGNEVLEVIVGVRDTRVRHEGLAATGSVFDGLERAFVDVPGTDGDIRRVFLDFFGRENASTTMIDHHVTVLQTGSFDRAAVRLRGVRVGLETNLGTVWLQGPDEAWTPQITEA